MTSDMAVEFARHFERKHIPSAAPALAALGAQPRHSLRKLWEQSELPAGEFADEVSGFYALPRVSLPELLEAQPLTAQFSRRFLREMIVFPYRCADGGNIVAVADPSDVAAIRATQIVLGDDIALRVGSFDDIETALAERLGENHATALALSLIHI